MSESFAELFEISVNDTEMRPGTVILGEIVEIGKETVLVDAGLKSEAEIPLWQFKDMKGEVNIKVGEEVEVEIEAIEDGYGRTRLSREKASRARAWEKIEQAFQESSVIEGVITARIKGGFQVSVEGIRAFLPGSLYGIRPVTEADDDFETDKEPVELKVIKIDKARNNVVVSRKAVLEVELVEVRKKFLESLEEGQIVEGTVKNLTDYGVFVNLGGIDGLLHITDIAWKRVKHPSEVLSVGDTISVKVLNFDREKERISLGMKQLTEDPWLHVQRRYKIGDQIKGKITSIVDYGVFVEIEDGVKGLVHVSEMDWTSRNVYPAQLYNIGDEVDVQVLSIEVDRHRISLGIKQCTENPWVIFESNHKEGDRITGEIKSLTDFGIFVSLENNIDGLVHLNDLDWNRDGEEVIRNYKKGEQVEVVVLSIDSGKERISLGIKQVSEDPFLNFINANGKGSVVDGTVYEFEEKGVIIELEEGTKGFIRSAEVSKNDVRDVKDVFERGQEVKAKIMSIDRKQRKIYLSVKSLEVDLEREEIENYSESEGTSVKALGKKIKEKLFSESS